MSYAETVYAQMLQMQMSAAQNAWQQAERDKEMRMQVQQNEMGQFQDVMNWLLKAQQEKHKEELDLQQQAHREAIDRAKLIGSGEGSEAAIRELAKKYGMGDELPPPSSSPPMMGPEDQMYRGPAASAARGQILSGVVGGAISQAAGMETYEKKEQLKVDNAVKKAERLAPIQLKLSTDKMKETYGMRLSIATAAGGRKPSDVDVLKEQMKMDPATVDEAANAAKADIDKMLSTRSAIARQERDTVNPQKFEDAKTAIDEARVKYRARKTQIAMSDIPVEDRINAMLAVDEEMQAEFNRIKASITGGASKPVTPPKGKSANPLDDIQPTQ